MIAKPKPRRGAGHRAMQCPEYSNCLNVMAKKDAKTFNCEACMYQGQSQGKADPVRAEKKENKRLCEDCGQRTTISPTNPYCPVCLALRSNKGRSAKKKPKSKRPRGRPPKKRATASPEDAPKKEKTIQDVDKSEKAPVGPDTALTIDFGKYSPILRAVEKHAEDEMRPVDLQVIYILNKYLNGRQADGQRSI